MRQKYSENKPHFASTTRGKQKGIIPVVLALILGVVAIVVLVLVLLLVVYLNHVIAGLIGGGNQPTGNSGTGNCTTQDTLDDFTIKKTEGPLSQEDHLVTQEDATKNPVKNLGDTSWGCPRSNQGIETHLEITKFSQNCAGGNSNCKPNSQEWTPGECANCKNSYSTALGCIGKGNQGILPPASVEPWVINFPCGKNPKNGARVIVCRKDKTKCVVAAAGYECGPSDESFVGGARAEVLSSLGITHGGEVTVGFAQDQSLPYGPVVCGGGANIVGNGQCAIPVAHYTLTKKGYLAHMNYGLHRGLDFMVPNGTPVYATMDGTIVESVDVCQTGDNNGCNSGWGNFITIRHSNNFYSEYHHLAHGTLLAKGTVVKKGQQIALSDNNGTSSGPHLHFQVMTANDHNAHINPNPCLGNIPRSM